MAKGGKGLEETWMWNRAQELLEEAERLQRSFFQLARPGSRCASWEPPVDVFETPTELWILVALPGVEPEHVVVRHEGRTVVVSGERSLPEALRRGTVHRLEIPHGRFERRVPLAHDRRFELAQYQLSHGCLAVSLRKVD